MTERERRFTQLMILEAADDPHLWAAYDALVAKASADVLGEKPHRLVEDEAEPRE